MTELKQANFKPALGAFSKAVDLNPDLLDAQIELGRMLFLSRARDKAMAKAELVLAKEPDNPKALVLKGSVFLIDQNADAVVEIMEGLIAADYKKPEVYMLLAAAHALNKDTNKADAAYNDGIAANPDAVNLYLAQAKFYRDTQRIEDAAALMVKVIELSPDNTGHKVTLGRWATGGGHRRGGRYRQGGSGQ
jgi:tetratricopeptide (TPR) repeat protein